MFRTITFSLILLLSHTISHIAQANAKGMSNNKATLAKQPLLVLLNNLL